MIVLFPGQVHAAFFWDPWHVIDRDVQRFIPQIWSQKLARSFYNAGGNRI